jgi:hypothetical protein
MKNRMGNGKTSRSAFIRSQPASLSADDVVSAGKEAGLEFKRDMVHKVRWQQRQHEKVHGKSKTVKPKIVRALKGGGLQELDGLVEALRQVVRAEVRNEVRRIMSVGAIAATA